MMPCVIAVRCAEQLRIGDGPLIAGRDTDPAGELVDDDADDHQRQEAQDHDGKREIHRMGEQISASTDGAHNGRTGDHGTHDREHECAQDNKGAQHVTLVGIGVFQKGARSPSGSSMLSMSSMSRVTNGRASSALISAVDPGLVRRVALFSA